MTSPNATFTELVSTTFRKHRKQISDNVSKNNAFLRRLEKGKQKRMEDGGLSIVTPLDYAANGTYQRFSGYDVLNINPSDVITAAEYQWKNIAITVTSSGTELRTNSGDSRITNLVKAKMKNAIRTYQNNFSVDVYSDGTLPNQINGLQALVNDSGTGTIGGIDSSAWPFWQNKVQSAAAPLQGGSAITPSATTIESLWLPLWLALTRGADAPDLILTDNNYFTFYEQSQTSLKRYTSSDSADGGFQSLKYKGADVIFDGGSGIPVNHAYFLNGDYFELVVHKDADLTELENVRPYNQDAALVTMLWMGNLSCSNRALQGVQKA